MCTLYKVSLFSANIFYNKLDSGSRERTLRVLKTAQPTILHLLVSGNGPYCFLQSGSSHEHRSELEERQIDQADAHNELFPAAELSARAYNALLKGNITTIKQFCALEFRDLQWLRNVGKKSVTELVAYRARLGMPMKLQG